MRTTPAFASAILFSLLALLAARAPAQETRKAPPAESLAGAWEGKLELGVRALRIGLRVQTRPQGYGAELDSIDQGARGIPVDEITLAGGKVQFKVASIGATYSGTLTKDGSSIEGTFHQGGAVPLTFRRVEKTSELDRPQLPKPPFPYREESVAFSHEPGKRLRDSWLPRATKENPARVSLSGTLTLPDGSGPFPAVALVTGSGPQNRDEELLGHKPFLVIADHLTRRGIAVLRYDDRGVAESSGKFSGATSHDFADDAEAAVRYLASRPEIAHEKIGIVGHSEGGLVAPIVGARAPEVAFLVLLAGPAVDGTEILKLQAARIAELTGADPKAVAEAAPLRAKLLALARDGDDSPATLAEMRALISKIEKLEAPKGGLPASAPADAELKILRDPWFRNFLAYDPRPTLRKLRCPVLALNGELDCQVIPTQNLPEMAAALSAGGNRDWATVQLAGLNHLFQECSTGSPTEYAQISQTFSPRALVAMSSWIEAHTR